MGSPLLRRVSNGYGLPTRLSSGPPLLTLGLIFENLLPFFSILLATSNK